MALPVRRTAPDEGTVTRFDALDELDRLNRRLDAFLETWRRLPEAIDGAFTPLADVEETQDAYLVEVELPGVQRGDVDIEVTGRRVSVRGERKEKERVGILRRRERIVGRFAYEITLPGDVDEDAVEAHLDDGVLTVRLPKPDHQRPRRIEIR